MSLLLVSHPAPVGGTFRELMRAEVHDQTRSLVVHGGFILIEALSVSSFLLLARVVMDAHARVAVANVALAVGAAALGLSMIVDGIVSPALAVRYLGAAPGIEAEALKGSLVLCSE